MYLKLVYSTNTKTFSCLYQKFLMQLLSKYNISFKIIKMPTVRKRLCVLKSPHVHKKSKEHFNLFIYKFLLLLKPSAFNFSKILLLNRPSIVHLKIKKL